ncbi:hypothetical protein ZIOFF_035861 [Zingiber officinale]|uniref:Uncharacterized protein n=1 Tax=Zingiber officinale TaxID=94328 RepID=A0A8J5L7E3_ZINOF|nr:hypothetical protein ZIOFF_035861 [Zingiber officinale]
MKTGEINQIKLQGIRRNEQLQIDPRDLKIWMRKVDDEGGEWSIEGEALDSSALVGDGRTSDDGVAGWMNDVESPELEGMVHGTSTPTENDVAPNKCRITAANFSFWTEFQKPLLEIQQHQFRKYSCMIATALNADSNIEISCLFYMFVPYTSVKFDFEYSKINDEDHHGFDVKDSKYGSFDSVTLQTDNEHMEIRNVACENYGNLMVHEASDIQNSDSDFYNRGSKPTKLSCNDEYSELGNISCEVSAIYLPVQNSKLECVDEQSQDTMSTDGSIEPDENDEFGDFDPYLFIRDLPELSAVVPRFRPFLLPKQTRSCPSTTLVLDLDDTKTDIDDHGIVVSAGQWHSYRELIRSDHSLEASCCLLIRELCFGDSASISDLWLCPSNQPNKHKQFEGTLIEPLQT